MIKLTDIQPNPNNPRFIRDDKFEKLKASIEQFPKMMALRPIVVDDDNMVLGGNMRLRALKELGYDKVPGEWVKKADELTEEEKRRFIITDNAGFGQWDWDVLANEWDSVELGAWGLDVPEEWGEEAEAEEDDYVEPENLPVDVVLGDLIEIGRHRLLCGDSTNVDDVGKLMGNEKADMVFTDPPYNIASDSKNFASDVSKSMNDLKNSDWDKNFNIEGTLSIIPLCVKSNFTAYIWTSHFLIQRIWDFFKECDYVSYLVWNKPNPMPSLSKRHPSWNTELCVYISNGNKRVVNYPKEGHFLSCRTVNKKSDGTHPTQKPIELVSPILSFSSNENQIILDLFLGSGTTMVAAHQLTRTCYGMEIDPKYCQVIIDRMHKLDPDLEIKINGKKYQPRTEEIPM